MEYRSSGFPIRESDEQIRVADEPEMRHRKVANLQPQK